MNMPVTTEQTQSTAIENVSMGFGSLQSFELMQRAAKLLSASTLVPVVYRQQKEIKEYGKVTGYEDNPNALPNCVIALNMSARMGADPLMIMQNLYVIEGRPSWSSQFVISAINTCGRYSPLRFDLSEAGEAQEVEYTYTKWEKVGGKSTPVEKTGKVNVRHQSCVAWAIERETGQRLESPKITIQMAIDEGWLTKNGSKWQTMPELMLRYRAAAFFGRLYSPEILMGLQTAEETHDIIDLNDDGSVSVTRETAPVAKAVPMPQSKSAKQQAKAEPVEIVPAEVKTEPVSANSGGEVLATNGEKSLIKAKLENANMPVDQAIEICAITNDFDGLTKSDVEKLLEFAKELTEG